MGPESRSGLPGSPLAVWSQLEATRQSWPLVLQEQFFRLTPRVWSDARQAAKALPLLRFAQLDLR